MTNQLHLYALYLAGGGQIFIALIYNWVRHILEWDAGIAAMPKKLNRQIAHTYGRYIQALNFAFGVVTILLADAFVAEPRLGAALAIILAVFWGVRTIIALTYYDIAEVTKQRPLFRWGNIGFDLLFAVLAAVYAWTAVLALRVI